MKSKGGIIMFHGKFGRPNSTKMKYLRRIACYNNYNVVCGHWLNNNPDERVNEFIRQYEKMSYFMYDDNPILVGSSMGGYVATCISNIVKPKKMFLIAPALYLPQYKNQNPIPCCDDITIIHGKHDKIVPVENVIKFAEQYNAKLHIIDSGHNMHKNLEDIGKLYQKVLNE